jgi:GrpB-like predicted nucleotidyltransferase (UPF0157 family)
MIGLRSGIVQLAYMHEACVLDFEVARVELLARRARPFAIEHIGSSAVPGLLAKPIVDVVIGLTPDLTLDSAISLLQSLGYRYRGNRSDAGGPIADYSVDNATTRHVHLTPFNERQWLRYLAFRDFLRVDAEARLSYESFKLRLAELHSTDRRSYTAEKIEFVERMTDRACSWSSGRRTESSTSLP